MVLRNTDPKDPIITFAPLLCIETLSRDDTLQEIQQRVVAHTPIAVARPELFAQLDEFSCRRTRLVISGCSNGDVLLIAAEKQNVRSTSAFPSPRARSSPEPHFPA